MKKGTTFLAVLMLGILLAAGKSFAQPGMHWRGSGGWGPGSQYGRMYDPKTVETISGEVTRVDLVTPMKGMSQGVHLAVKTDKGTVSVQLGPAWYIENQDVRIQPGDRVDITGSRVTINGQPAIIAKEVKKGDQVLALRDDNGFPAWSGSMMGRGRGMMPGAASGGTGTSGRTGGGENEPNTGAYTGVTGGPSGGSGGGGQ